MLLADSQVHEFRHHLSLHLMLEAVAVARHNSLTGHPVGRLLAPHTQGTVLINFYARQTLISQVNSQVDSMFRY